jgi:hypothetical protein
MIKISLKRIFCLLLLSQLFTANLAVASDGESLKRLHDMRIISYAILGDYYMFSGLEGDSRYSRDMDTGIADFEKLLTVVTKEISSTEDLASIVNDWQTYQNLIETNRSDFLSQGYANARLVGQLGEKAIDLNKSLARAYNDLKQTSQFPISKWTQITRDMALIIGTVTAEYSARGTSSMGQIMTIQINGEGMDQQAKIFDAHLKELKSAPGQDSIIAKSIDQVGVKWVFIAKSVANYNENSVPFIVNSYGARISKNLEAIGSHYANERQAKK